MMSKTRKLSARNASISKGVEATAELCSASARPLTMVKMKDLIQKARDEYEILKDETIILINEHFDTEIRRNLASVREAERRQDKREYDAMKTKFDNISIRYKGGRTWQY